MSSCFHFIPCDCSRLMNRHTSSSQSPMLHPSVLPGVPPTWARRPMAVHPDGSVRVGPCLVLRELMGQFSIDDSPVDLLAVRTWRRKLVQIGPLKFGEVEFRPPYYGSMSQTRWEEQGSC